MRLILVNKRSLPHNLERHKLLFQRGQYGYRKLSPIFLVNSHPTWPPILMNSMLFEKTLPPLLEAFKEPFFNDFTILERSTSNNLLPIKPVPTSSPELTSSEKFLVLLLNPK